MDTKLHDTSIFNELSEHIVIRVKSSRMQSHQADWIEYKSHTDYDLWFIQHGTVRIDIHGTTKTAGPGDVVFFYPRIPYTASAVDSPCHFIYIHFDFEIGRQERILNDFPLPGIVPASAIKNEFKWFAQTFQQAQQSDAMPGNRLYVKACLMAVIAKIIELYGSGQYTGTFPFTDAKKSPGRSLKTLQPILKHIHDHLDRPLRMKQLADLTGMSEKYFITFFKEALGITPGQYIYQVKMNQAREYLYEQSYSIQQIADLLGYPDPFTFSKAFKKYYKVPPSRFE